MSTATSRVKPDASSKDQPTKLIVKPYVRASRPALVSPNRSTWLGIISDRTEDVSDVAKTLVEHWAYRLYEREPGPAMLYDGVLIPTDLDLACFLSALVDRHAVINVPEYKARRAVNIHEDQHVISRGNRHGKIMGIVSNKEVFSFSVRILDQNVIRRGDEDAEDDTGAYRNFLLTDLNGNWYDGWKTIEFLPSAKENSFLSEGRLWTDSSVVFKNFVHPNRARSFFGQYYLETKALLGRLEEEQTHLKAEIDRILKAGVTYRAGSGVKAVSRPHAPASKGESVPVNVMAFQAAVDVPMHGKYPQYSRNSDVLQRITNLYRHRKNHVIPRLQFACRATELAYVDAFNADRKVEPLWVGTLSNWETGYREKGKRTDWDRLEIIRVKGDKPECALRCRSYLKTERVRPE